MNFSSFLLMRHEILLLAITLLLLVGEIFIHKNKKSSIVHLAIFLFGIHTAINDGQTTIEQEFPNPLKEPEGMGSDEPHPT